MGAAKQSNDVYIRITDKSGMDIANALSIVYKIFTKDKSQVLITKTIGSGIEVVDGTVEIHLDSTDTGSLKGIYYEEMKVQGVNGDVFTVLQNSRRFEPTYITEI